MLVGSHSQLLVHVAVLAAMAINSTIFKLDRATQPRQKLISIINQVCDPFLSIIMNS